MLNRIACAPCCWGVEFASNETNPSWGKVLMDASDSGYHGIELGPDGYFPLEKGLLRSACQVRGLEVCAGKIELPFADTLQMSSILDEVAHICQHLASLEVKTLLIMEGVHSQRSGHRDHSATAIRLTVKQKQQLNDNLDAIISIANKYGLRCLLHPGVGGYIRYQDEIDFVLHQLPESRLGLCLDVGHAFLDGMDPVSIIHQYGRRIEHVHLKDISMQKRRLAVRDRLEWVDAYSQGIVTPLGEGDIQLSQIIEALNQLDYQGWLVVEHEHACDNAEQVSADLSRSRQYLQRLMA
ncbi:sugar phosphate isomerase/epimerase family protein [Vibrio sp. WXL210]|uniref:sugar phosphate isomerase/epimerase family protein n=1 Tax=Vibrio sp. WXL210 TaxID=3450709 RepID=UPI003EC4B4FA